MRSFFVRLLALLLLVSLLAGCAPAPAPTDPGVTQPSVAAPTDTPTQPPTEAPTEAPMEAPTEAPTEAAVETTAVPVMAQEEETPAETEPELDLLAETEPVAKKEIESKSWIGLVMIAGVLTFLLAGAMIFRSVSRKKRY